MIDDRNLMRITTKKDIKLSQALVASQLREPKRKSAGKKQRPS